MTTKSETTKSGRISRRTFLKATTGSATLLASLQSLAESYRTLSSGIYYENPPEHRLQRALYEKLKAAIEGLRAINEECDVEVVTDSEYLKNGITSWIAGWKRNGWMTSTP